MHMTYNIQTMTIDAHDGKEPMKLRFATVDGVNLHIADDCFAVVGIKPNASGDYRPLLKHFGIPFAEADLAMRGEPIGRFALITQAGFGQLTSGAAGRTVA
jgi:hypothetical protein